MKTAPVGNLLTVYAAMENAKDRRQLIIVNRTVTRILKQQPENLLLKTLNQNSRHVVWLWLYWICPTSWSV